MGVRIYVRVSKKILNTITNSTTCERLQHRSLPGRSLASTSDGNGSGLKEHNEFERMMLDASRHEFDLLLFWKLDRVSREGSARRWRCLENLKGWGVGWRSYQEPRLDTGNEGPQE